MEYKNPYLGLPKEQKLRTTFEIDLKDIAVLRSFDPKDGTLQTTAGILFKKLINELLKSNLERGDFSAYQHAVAKCHLALGFGNGETIVCQGTTYFREGFQRSPAAVAPAGDVNTGAVEAVSGNVGRGTKKLARKAA
jgi:hypothetical protein